MTERQGAVAIHGKPLTLVGQGVQVGEKAPDFEVVDNDLNPVKFTSLEKKIYIIASVPSLDTPVCDIETRKFNEEASRLGAGMALMTISMDLPFAQKRWCGAAGVDRLQTYSDHREASFGLAYGVLIKELRLLARAVFVIDREGVVRYIQVVKELTEEPDYEAVLRAVQALG